MGNLFGQEKTIKEICREQKRTVDRSIRQLEREQSQLGNQEKKLIADIKKVAKSSGSKKSLKIMAKDLVRALSLQMTEMSSQQVLTDSMKGITRAMVTMNRTINLPVLNRVMQEFVRTSEQMNMKVDSLGDVMDDAMAEEDDEEEEEKIINEVFDEIGINLNNDLVGAPVGKNVSEVKEDKEDKELEARLNNLKR